MKYQAIVNLPAKTIETLSLLEIENHFMAHEVSIKALNFTNTSSNPPAYKLNLYGTKENLRTSVKQIYLLASQAMHGIETEPAKNIPEGIMKKLDEKLYNFCADEYIKHCEKNDESPHPEVCDEFTNK